MISSVESSRSRSRSVFIASAVLLLLIAVGIGCFATIRTREHQKRLADLTDDTAKALRTYSEVERIGARYDACWEQFRQSALAVYAESRRVDGIGDVAVLNDRISVMKSRNSNLIEVLGQVQQLSSDSQVPPYQSAASKFSAQLQDSNDEFTSFSATMQEVLNNPFLALGLNGSDVGKRFWTAVGKIPDEQLTFSSVFSSARNQLSRAYRQARTKQIAEANRSLKSILFD